MTQPFDISLAGIEKIKAELAIKATLHPDLPLAILNYCQIKSPKTDPIVRQCRGLVVDYEAKKVVARGFSRFFNYGEIPDEKFDRSSIEAFTKEDGSLVLLYNYRGEWRVNTRGSFADGQIMGTSKTWGEMIRSAMNWSAVAGLDPGHTYCLEFCSPMTQVVRIYPKPKLVMLAVFHTETGLEQVSPGIDKEARVLGVAPVEAHSLRTPAECKAFIEATAEKDASWEGLVLRDKFGRRVKIKSARYVDLHHMQGNGSVYHPRRIIPFVLKGEQKEVLLHFPAAANSVRLVEAWLAGIETSLRSAWECNRNAPDQKTFALAVKDLPFSWALFTTRKGLVSDPADALRMNENKMIERFLAQHPEWATVEEKEPEVVDG